MFTSLKKGSLAVNVLIGCTFFIFIFGHLGRLELFELPIFFNLYEVFLAVTFIALIFTVRVPKKTMTLPVVKWGGIFFGWMLISLVVSLFFYNNVQNILASLYFIRLLFYFAFCLYLYEYISRNKKVIPYFSSVVVVMTIGIVISSVVQYFFYPNIGNLAYLGWDPHLFRLVGLYFDPPVTASVFALLGLFIFFSKLNRYVTAAFLASLGILFFLTYSRGGFLAIFATILLYSWKKMKPIYIAGFIAATVLVYLIIPKNMSEGLNLMRTASIKTRVIDYQKGVAIWKKNPIMGIGYNHIRVEKDAFEEEPISEKYNPSHASASFHSSFLMILVTGGIVGLILYGIFLLQLFRLHEFAFYGVVFLSTYSLTDNVLLHPFVLFLFFTLASIIHPSRK